SATATRDNLSLIAVVLGCETSKERFSDASTLLDYGFANYSFYINNDISKKYDIIVKKGKESICRGIPENTEGILVKKGQENKIKVQINVKESIKAPVYKDEKVGEIIYMLDNKELHKSFIRAASNVDELNFYDYFILNFKKIFYKM
ncbi:MAG: D-alanyl-D-alanine carboxypeptidase, partial [Clostridia bacterium]|nr:D-alanyl-D-alanine carboxypeptidase [Clostridia bacterium]